MKTKGPSTDRIIGISAMLISLMTLIIFLYQTHLIKDQSRLSVRPRLTFNKNVVKSITKNETEGDQIMIEITLSLRNDGLGPAIIESSRILDRGSSYELMTFFEEAYPALLEFGFFTQITELTQGEAIRASKSIDLFTYQYDLMNEEAIKKLLNAEIVYDFPFEYEVIYSSMYEERWQVRSNTEGHPVPVD